MTVIKVEKLSEAIKGKEILQDISFQVNRRECVALIGPNGAGKTTLMSCLLGDKKVKHGSVLLNGQAPKSSQNKAKVAVLLQENVIPKQLKVKELIRFFQEIYLDHLEKGEIDELLQFTDKQANQLAEKLSGGQKRLLSFVLCLVGKPDILFLDEPTAGMDTSTRRRFWEIVHDLKEKGTTILYSSHYIEEVEHTAERLLVLHQGKLIRDTTPYAMRQEEAKKQVTVPIRYQGLVEDSVDEKAIQVLSDRITFETENLEELWQALQVAGCSISEIEIQQRTLLDTLFEQTKEEA